MLTKTFKIGNAKSSCGVAEECHGKRKTLALKLTVPGMGLSDRGRLTMHNSKNFTETDLAYFVFSTMPVGVPFPGS